MSRFFYRNFINVVFAFLFLIGPSLQAGTLYRHAEQKTIEVQKELNQKEMVVEPRTEVEPRSAHLTGQGWFVAFTIFITFVLMVWDIAPPHLALFGAAIVLAVSGIVKPYIFVQGFSQEILLMVAMLCVIAKTLEVNGILKYIAQSFLTRSRNRRWQLLSIIVPAYVMSLFINNVPVVLILMPVVRQWAKNQMRSPSKFLIPLSFAAMLGGMCTLMGSTTNLVVDSLVRTADPQSGFGFFELSLVGIPCGIAGLVVLFTLSDRLLPSYPDPLTSLSQQTREFSSEFLIEEGCPFAGDPISLAAQYFNGASIIEIERNGVLIDNPKRDKELLVGDRLVFVGDVSQIAPLHCVPHLKSLSDPHFQVDETSLHFSEIVISETSSFIGKTLRQAHFRSHYDATVLAIYRQGKRVVGRIGDVLLQAGDTLMLLTSGKWKGRSSYQNDFYTLIHNEEVKPTPLTNTPLILAVISAVIVCAGFGTRPMLYGSILAGLVFLVTRSISPLEAVKSVYWNLLLLIASAFTVAEGLRATQAVDLFADVICMVAGQNPHLLIGFIFLMVVLLAEAITSNAATLLMYPVALKAALIAGFDLPSAAKAVGVTVAIAASSAFQTPIGYQTNLIVYGPGSYRFRDYAKVGIPLCLLIGSIAVYLIPKLWLNIG